ncbi:sulfate/molybdate ABC transporter ATP-binding protein [Wielerella bovis]|uniref:sulfate/molybdate ABC transporter ATP-binding protein n=1 Tax=Wielerella bovis TaxID=2917790 RepID=UPI002019B08D|nr:TOBE-like domain-containing protein [Wielerella bovis]ULJ65220.1 TOBE-like domain-containing protein [Wielerella bovis]ULJ67566.1 TOBE-like domain-containing protein [Wielerella bovis]
MSIQIKNLNKHFGKFHALKDINLTADSGSLTALLGPSGCGKTTLLRIIAGLETASDGQILFDNQDVSQVSVRERQVGFMFQHYALFRHMNVADNIAFGLDVKPRATRPSKEQIAQKVNELLKLVQLEHLAKAFPSQLSGGQRQRIALARALATEPKLLLLDEPFGALDAKVRKELRAWLRQIQQKLGITTILVTHDQEEALEMADQIVIMNHGVVEQIGTGDHLYHEPKNVFVNEFLGETNAFEFAKIEQGELHIGGYRETLNPRPNERQNVTAYVRPHELDLYATQPENAIGAAEIVQIHHIGAVVRVALRLPETPKLIWSALSPAQFKALNVQTGDTVWLLPQQTSIFRLPEMVEYVI